MTINEFKEEMCTKCIHCCDKCEHEAITEEIMEGVEPPVTRTYCKNYSKWSGHINATFRNLDWRDGRDGEGKENGYRNSL